MGYLKGEISIDQITFPFTGVTFDRFGGHSIDTEFEYSSLEMKLLLGLEEHHVENLRIA